MRRARWIVVASCGVLTIGAACAIDESGLESSDGGGDGNVIDDGSAPPDVVIDAPLPPTCKSIDVSCLGFDAGVPDGWSPYVVEFDGGACPSSAFTSSPWFANARLAPGACSCACAASGSWSCTNTSTITVSNGGTCGTDVTVDAGVCQTQNPPSSHLELANVVNATSNGVACSPDGSAPAQLADPVTLCSGACDAGAEFCAQPIGTRCIAADMTQSCPPTFTPFIVGGAVTGSCNNACTCTPGNAPECTATATVYFGAGPTPNPNCSTIGMFTSQTLLLDGSCEMATQNYDSFSVNWNAPPSPTCNAAPSGGNAGLSAVKTICCK